MSINGRTSGDWITFGPRTSKYVKRLLKSTSTHQRLVIGGTALLIQPGIDLRNKRVDEETSTINASRSISRAVVGTTTGVIIREVCMDFAKKHIKKAPETFLDKLITPTAFTEPSIKSKSNRIFAHRYAIPHSKILGTAFALAVMLATNFIIDAPCTNILSRYVHSLLFAKPKKEGGEPK